MRQEKDKGKKTSSFDYDDDYFLRDDIIDIMWDSFSFKMHKRHSFYVTKNQSQTNFLNQKPIPNKDTKIYFKSDLDTKVFFVDIFEYIVKYIFGKKRQYKFRLCEI